MSWDAVQRAVLAELGHVLYRLPAGAATVVGMMAADADEQMLVQLAKAAGLSPDMLELQPGIASRISELRGDAVAKRALWPQLRALRRGCS